MDALLLAACRGALGRSYCVGGFGERTNRQIVELICNSLYQTQPKGSAHSQVIQRVSDRPGHDRRYAIDPSRIQRELGWQPSHNIEEGLVVESHNVNQQSSSLSRC